MEQLLIRFDADYPNDSIWTAAGDLEVPAGRSLASNIALALNMSGYHCSEVVQRDYYGWEFHIRFRKFRVIAVLQRAEDWLLSLIATRSLAGILCSRSCVKQGLRDFADDFKLILEASERIPRARVLTERQYRDELNQRKRS